MNEIILDHNLILEGINEALKMIKQQKYNEAQEKIATEFERLLDIEIFDRSTRLDEINKSIFQIDMTIIRISIQYHAIKKDCPHAIMTSIDNYLHQLKCEKIKLQIKKKYIARR